MDKYETAAFQVYYREGNPPSNHKAIESIATILREAFPEPAPAEQGEERVSEALEAIAKARDEVSALCNGKRWTMCIPAREDEDSDLVIADALHKAEIVLAAHPQPKEPQAEASGEMVRNPERCNQDVFDHGEVVTILACSKSEAEQICRDLTDQTGIFHDWHFCGGRPVIMRASPAPTDEKALREAYQQGLADMSSNFGAFKEEIFSLIEYVKCPGFERHKSATKAATFLETFLAHEAPKEQI